MKSNVVGYSSLMSDQEVVGGFPVRFTSYNSCGEMTLLPESQFSFIFVLQGEVNFVFTKYNNLQLVADRMMVVNKEQIVYLQCQKDTIVLECVVSQRMVPLMQSTSQAFSLPCSEIIPLNPKLKQWCQQMFQDMIGKEKVIDNDYFHQQCKLLAESLLTYPRGVLGTLYVPIYACSIQCDHCSKVFIK